MKNKLNEIEALQNAASLSGITIRTKFFEDRRKKVFKYFGCIGNTSISPVLNYEQMNCFLLGWSRNRSYSKGNNEIVTI